ncbi:MAG: glycoside hydrolase family 27 protein [Ignavibacteria bacterium]|nr:glycoside hydrolase family 27 protein [Ignavibacteria bacterium]
MIFSAQVHSQKFEGLALTPPMGWNSWNKYACDVNEKMIRETADAMVSSGMKDAGYQYVVIDDCWHGKRDSLGFIHPDPERFPSGIKALADYIHAKGLKFGIYSDAGWNTCGGRPGSRGHEYQDAMMYASWGVDYLKYDWCNTEGLKAEGAYLTMRDALFSFKRPIVFSLCEWGNDKPWQWGGNIGHLWRTTGDITAYFDSVVNHGTWSSLGVMQILDKQEGIRAFAGPGHWNDPDMMEVGNGMSNNEDRAHFSIWCMLAAPLIAGNDISKMSKETVEILTNKEAIAVNQDSLGIQGFKYSAKDELEIWFKPLSKDEWAVCFLNRGKTTKDVNFLWKDETVTDSLSNRNANFISTDYSIRDLWIKKSIGTTAKNFAAKIPAHDVILLKLTPVR